MTRRKHERSDTVPRELAEKQISAYRYAFREAVRRANEAIKQRDYYREQAIETRCDLMQATGGCPDGFCPMAFDLRCARALEVDKKARYL